MIEIANDPEGLPTAAATAATDVDSDVHASGQRQHQPLEADADPHRHLLRQQLYGSWQFTGCGRFGKQHHSTITSKQVPRTVASCSSHLKFVLLVGWHRLKGDTGGQIRQ